MVDKTVDIHRPGCGGWRGGGRPKGSVSKTMREHQVHLAELCRLHTHTAMNAMIDIAQNGDSDTARATAVKFLVERGYGTAPQNIELTGADGGPVIQRVERVIIDPKKRDEEE